jgi:hypothetical protein
MLIPKITGTMIRAGRVFAHLSQDQLAATGIQSRQRNPVAAAQPTATGRFQSEETLSPMMRTVAHFIPFAALAGGILILVMPRHRDLSNLGRLGRAKQHLISFADNRARQRPRQWQGGPIAIDSLALTG